jgi:hypothetical protein
MHAHEMGEGAFYSRSGNPGESFFARFHSRTARRTAGSGVGEGLAETGLLILQLARFQNLPAVQTFHVLRILILGDQSRSFVLAGRIGC